MEYAWAANHRHDWQAAVERWLAARERFPGRHATVFGLAAAYTALGRHGEADAEIEAAMAHHPLSRDYAITYASQAQGRADLCVARERWAAMRESLPHEPLGYSKGAMFLHDIGQPDDAIALLKAAVVAVPGFETVPTGLLAYADFCAGMKRDLNLHRMRQLSAAFPTVPGVALRYGAVCRTLLEWDEGIAALESAVALDPESVEIMGELIHNLGLKGDIESAATYAKLAAERFPGNSFIQEKIDQIRFRAAISSVGGGTAADGVLSGIQVSQACDAQEDLRDLMAGFLSLGFDCLFGFVQRTYSAEPLDLLRWARIPFHNLLIALDHRFEGIGNPENIIITAQHIEFAFVGGREYTSTDSSYDIWAHTFVPVSAGGDTSALRLEVARRNAFLARDLIDELEVAERICVYVDSNNSLNSEDHLALFKRLRRYGANRLLFVGKADDGGATGLLRQVTDGLFIAALPSQYVTEHRVREYQPWVDLCRQVLLHSNLT